MHYLVSIHNNNQIQYFQLCLQFLHIFFQVRWREGKGTRETFRFFALKGRLRCDVERLQSQDFQIDFLIFLEALLFSSSCCLVIKSCLTLLQPHPWTVAHQASLYEVSQVRILEWGAISSSGGSSQPRDRIRIITLAGRFFTTEPSGKYY